MKKYFMFAVVVTAGMLTSCSSESLTGSDPKIETPDQADLVPIEIGVASSQTTGTTRGTGTVGGTTVAANIWKGEKVNVLMYKIDSNNKPTFDFATDGATNPNNLYDATMTLVTPLAGENKVSGLAKEINGGDPYESPAGATYKLKYYPPTGRFDFWGFYLGGGAAKPSDPITVAPTLVTVTAKYDDPNTTPTANNAKAVNFDLDGTMDLMVAKAATGTSTATAATSIVGNVPFTENQTTAVSVATAYASSYSAKSARGGLQPDLLFKHALTRLTFKVKAGNADAVGVHVKAIKVHSMTKGQLVVAYDYTQGNISAANSIIWDNAYTPETDFTDLTYQSDTYPALALKERHETNGMQNLTAYDLVAADITDAHAIGEALLVAPQKKYWLEVEYDATAAPAAAWQTGTPTGGGSSISPAPITADIARTTTTDVFEAGKSYNVTITLYGPQKISITTSLEAWTNVDEDITIIGE